MSIYEKAAPCYEECGNCGKQFYIPNQNEWVFWRGYFNRTGRVWLCSWKCLRAWEKEHPPGRKSTWYDIPEDDPYEY